MLTLEKPNSANNHDTEGQNPDVFANARLDRSDSTGQAGGGYRTYDESADRQEQTEQTARALSIALPIVSLLLACWIYNQPGPITTVGCAYLILCLLAANHHLRTKQRETIETLASQGTFYPLPPHSVAISLGLSLGVFLICCAAVAGQMSSPDPFLIYKLTGLGALYTFAVPAVTHAINDADWRSQPLYVLAGYALGCSFSLSSVLILASALAFLAGQYDRVCLFTAAAVLPLFSLWHDFKQLCKLLLSREWAKRGKSLALVACSVAAACCFALAPELREFGILSFERMATCGEEHQEDFALQGLSFLQAAQDLQEQCQTDSTFTNHTFEKHTFLSPLMPVNLETAKRVYFKLTGKGFRPLARAVGSGSDYELGSLQVGALRPHLDLQESMVTGFIDSDSLTSSLYWTMNFENQSPEAQEARALIAIPAGATVSRLTLWINGVQQEAAFSSAHKAQNAYQWIVQRHRDPSLVTEVGRDKIFLQAYPVPRFAEMKVRIGITAPLQVINRKEFSLSGPRVLSSNFALNDVPTQFKLVSDCPVSSDLTISNVKTNANQEDVIGDQNALNLTDSRLAVGTFLDASQPCRFRIHRASAFQSVITRASHSAEHSFISESLESRGAMPKRLAVVIDGSAASKSAAPNIEKFLSSLPATMPITTWIATRHSPVVSHSTKEAIENLRRVNLDGGCDNENALIQAGSFVKNENHGAIVWIHGPQPYANQERLFALMKRGDHRLRIYDCALVDDASNAIRDCMVNLDATACPDFKDSVSVGTIDQDLEKLVRDLSLETEDLKVVRRKIQNVKDNSVYYDDPTVSRVSTLWAADEARACVALGDSVSAEKLGQVYRVVTPATSAVVLETEADYARNDLSRKMSDVLPKDVKAPKGTADGTSTLGQGTGAEAFAVFSGNSQTQTSQDGLFTAPSLSGATNGTIGPQGQDATYVTGVNTAGTVRVNNLENLEVCLNGLANLVGLLGAILGLSLIVSAMTSMEGPMARMRKNVLGCLCVLLGAVTPALLNGLVTCARDMNLFS